MSEPDAIRVRDVVFAPVFPRNPYQERLRAALSRLAVDVAPLDVHGAGGGSLLEGLDPAPDVLHLHWLHPYLQARSLPGAFLRSRRLLSVVERARRRGVGLVWTVHNLLDHERRRPRLEARTARSLARRVHRIVVHTAAAAESTLAFLADPTLSERIRVVPHPHYLGAYPDRTPRDEARRRLDLEDDALVFLFFGRIRPYKGVFDLIDAFASAKLPRQARLLLAGKASGDRERVRVKRRAKKTPRVVLRYGRVPDEEVALLHRAADVGVLPYRDVLTSGAALLQMGFGLPLVAPRVGDLAELLDETRAFLYRPGDPDGLRRALEDAARARDALAAMGSKNLDAVRPLDPDAVAKRLLTVYEEARLEGAASARS